MAVGTTQPERQRRITKWLHQNAVQIKKPEQALIYTQCLVYTYPLRGIRGCALSSSKNKLTLLVFVRRTRNISQRYIFPSRL